MGQIVEVKCTKCGYKESLKLGAGMLYNKPDVVLGLFDDASKEEIKKTLSDNKTAMWYAYKELGRCISCKKLSEIAVFKLSKTDGDSKTIVSRCKCQKEAELIDSDNAIEGHIKVKCPICNEEMEVKVIGNWD